MSEKITKQNNQSGEKKIPADLATGIFDGALAEKNSVTAIVHGIAFRATVVGGRYEADGTRMSWGVGKLHPDDSDQIGIFIFLSPELINDKEYEGNDEFSPLQIYYVPAMGGGKMYPDRHGKARMHHDRETMLVTGTFSYSATIPGQHVEIENGTIRVGPTSK